MLGTLEIYFICYHANCAYMAHMCAHVARGQHWMLFFCWLRQGWLSFPFLHRV